MKRLIPTLTSILLSASIGLDVSAETQPAGYVDFGHFSPSGSGEFVEVNIKHNVISMVARLAEKSEPELADLIRGLKVIRVNVIGLDEAKREEVTQRIAKIRARLDDQGWERIVTVQKKDEDVGIYLKTRGEEAVEGLVITVLEGNREAVLINIVGDIKPEKVALIGERFHLEPLEKVAQSLKKEKKD